jgi:hypothetical protein
MKTNSKRRGRKPSWWTWERFKDLMQILTPFLVILAAKWIK